MKKRVFSILLCLCMAVTLLPVSAFAIDVDSIQALATSLGGNDFAMVSGNTVTLRQDVQLTDTINITSGTVEFDLAGKTITGAAGTTALSVSGDTSLTISNTGGADTGKIVGGGGGSGLYAGGGGSGLSIAGGSVTISGGSFIGGGGGHSTTDPGGISNGTNGGGGGSGLFVAGGSVAISGGSFTGGVGGNGGGGSYGGGSGGGGGSGLYIAGGSAAISDGSFTGGVGGDGGYGRYLGTLGSGGADGGGLSITGGSVKASSLGCTPTNGQSANVELYTLTVTDGTNAVRNTAVSTLTATAELGYAHGMTDVKTDSDGKLYVYLPAGKTAVSVTAGGVIYSGSVTSNAATLIPLQAKWGFDATYAVGSGTLTEAVAYANALDLDTAYIQLQSNVDTAATLDFASGKTTVLDLNGKTIDAKQGNFSVITVNGTLTLCDASSTQIAEQGKITGGNAESGGGVRVNGGSVTMNGGKITGNSATGIGQYSGGGGVFLSTGSIFIMISGSITGNTATGDGGGVNVNHGGSFTINGGSITENSCGASGGGGIFVASTAMLTVGGTAQVTGNTKGTDSDAIASNVYLTVAEDMSPPTVRTLTVIPTLSAGAKIGITSDTAPTAGVPVSITGESSVDYSGYFFSDNSAYEVIAAESYQLKLAAAAQAITKAAAANGSFTVMVDGSEASSAVQGTTVTVTPAADTNYELDTITVTKTGDTSTTVTVTNDSFTMPDHPVTVTVSFRAIPAPSSGGTPSVTVPASSNEGSVNVSATLSGGTANISVTDTQLNKIASAGGTDTGTVKVDISDLRADAAVIPAKLVAAAANATGSEGLEVEFSTGSVALDVTALTSIGSNKITVSVEDVKTTELTEAQKKTLGDKADSAVIVDVNVLVNGVKTSNFGGGEITVRVPYTPKAGEDTSKLVVWYLADDGSIEPMSGKYNAEGKCYEFSTTHLSTYVLTSFPFTDVAADAYYYSAVAWAVAGGVTEGTGEATFSPDAICTRAQAVTFLWRAMGSPEPTGSTCQFTDVDPNAYYYKAILWAAEKGVIEGTSDTTFSPDDTVTRAQVVTLEWRAAGKPAATAESPFTDVASGAYYEDAVAWAVAQKIAEGTSEATFSPAEPCTRAQIVTFLYRYLAK